MRLLAVLEQQTQCTGVHIPSFLALPSCARSCGGRGRLLPSELRLNAARSAADPPDKDT